MSIQSQNQDLHRKYAILSQGEEIPFPDNVREEHFTVPFIDHAGEVQEAKGCLYLPEGETPKPLVYFSYYKITKESLELKQYLHEGWAVASPFEDSDNNPEITRDGLVSNSALLYELRHRPEIDEARIAVVGGSAGGYTAMMLSALHLFPACTVASGAFANVYFNYRRYAPYLSTFNLPAFLSLKEEERTDLVGLFSKLPIPYGIVFNTCRTPEIDARLDDLQTGAAVTPTMLADCYSNPLMEVHNTSDILCPVDQITRGFTCSHVSDDLPADFKYKLADYDLPEGFDRSFTEQLPHGSYSERLIPVLPKGTSAELPFDEKPFQINIIDEGEPQSHGSHGTDMPKGSFSQKAYMKHAFENGNSIQGNRRKNMSGRKFTEEEMETLRKNRFVQHVTASMVYFSAEFKELVWKKMQKNVCTEDVIRSVGIDPEILGKTRISGLRYLVRKEARTGQGFHDYHKYLSSADLLKPEEKIQLLKQQLAYKDQEIEFLKKIISAEQKAEK